MSASESDLRLRIAADSSAVKPGLTPGMQAVSELRAHVGSELGKITALSDQALNSVANHLNVLVRERIPVGGGLFVNLTDNLKNIIEPAKATEGSILKLDAAIDSLSRRSGVSAKDVASFLVPFSKLETQAQRDAASVEFFANQMQGPLLTGLSRSTQFVNAGTIAAQTFQGSLQGAASEAKLLGTASESAAGGLLGLGAAAGPVGLALAVGVAETALLVIALYELTKISVEAATNYATYGEELGKAAIQTGLSVEQLHGLKLLADENKVSFEGLTLGFGRYLRAVIEAQQGNKQFGEEFERLGIDVTKLGNDPQAAIQALVAAFNRLGPSMLTNQAAIALLGREGVRVVGALIAAGASLDEITAKAQQFSKFTTEDSKAAKQLSEEMAATKFAIEGYNLELGRTVEPIVLEFQKELLKLLIDNKEVIGDVVKAFGLFIQVNGTALLVAVRGTIEVVHDLTGAWKELKIAAEAATIIGIPQALRDSQALYEQEKARFEPKPETSEEAARRALTPVASTIPSNELTRFAGLAPPPAPPQPEAQDVTSLRLKKSLEELKVAADTLAVTTAAAIAQTETKIKEGNAAWADGTQTIEANLKAATQAQLNYLAEQKRQLEEQKKAAVTPTDAFKVQQEINKVDQSILAAQTKFQTDYAAKETALRDHLRAEKIKALETDAKVEKDAAERLYAARENQGKLSAEAELAATEARNKAIFDVDRQALVNTISLYPKQAEARQDLERKLRGLESQRTTAILEEDNKRQENLRNAIKDRIEIEAIGAQGELSVTRTKNAEILAEARALTSGLKIVASDQLQLELGLLAAKSDARIKAINDEIAAQEKRKAAITAQGQIAGQLTVEEQVKQEQAVNDELERLYAQRIHLYNEDVNAAANAHLSHEKLAQLETKLAIDEKSAEITLAEKEQRDLASKGLTPEARAIQMATLNAKIKELTEQRNAIEKEGNIKAAEARQQDLDDLKQYEDNYAKLVYAGLVLDEEISRLHIRLLIATHASRREIIQAQFAEEKDADDKHHAQELTRLKNEYDAAVKSAKTMQDKLAALKKYHADVDKENKRQDLADEERKAREKREAALAGPGGGFFGGLNSGQLATLEKGVRSFADVSTVALSAIGAAVNGLAQGVGNLVQNWVLMGTAGPDAARKMLASILASVASQAAVQAIMELAYGFAALTPWGAAIYGPAALHFKAAALFGSVAAITAVAGRAVAGNAFQSGKGSAGAGGGGGSTSGSLGNANQNKPATIKEEWVQRRPIIIQLHGDASQFNWKVIEALHDDVSKNGRARALIVSTATKGS